MPRVSPPSDELEVPKKKVTRSRAPKVTDDTTPITPRRRVSRTTTTTKEVVREMPSVNARKAPTPLAAERRRTTKNSRVLLFALAFAFILTSIGVGVGISDQGQIDVVAVVNERNEQINRGELRDAAGNPITTTMPVQSSENLPNGGLIPATIENTPPPTPSDTNASSTNETATSTETTDEAKTEANTADDAPTDAAATSSLEASL